MIAAFFPIAGLTHFSCGHTSMVNDLCVPPAVPVPSVSPVMPMSSVSMPAASVSVLANDKQKLISMFLKDD